MDRCHNLLDTPAPEVVGELIEEVRRLRAIIEKEREFVARFLIPWKRHLDRTWLDGFVESGSVVFDELGMVHPTPLDKPEGLPE